MAFDRNLRDGRLRTLGGVLVAGVLGLALAGCGGGDADGGSSAAGGSTSTTASTSGAADTGASAGDPAAVDPSATPSEAQAGNVSVDAGAGVAENVASARDGDAGVCAAGAVLSNMSSLDTTDPTAALNKLESAADALKAASPPVEVKEQWALVQGTFGDYVTSIKEIVANPGDSGNEARFSAAVDLLTSTPFQTAVQDVQAYVSAHC